MHHSRMTVRIRLDDLLAIQSQNIAAIGLLEEQRATGHGIERIQDEIRESNGIIMKYDPLYRYDTMRLRQRRGRSQKTLF